MLNADNHILIDWDRRRTNLRILIAAKGTNATRLAKQAGLSPNTVSKFTSGKTPTLSESSATKIMPLLGLESLSELDTENPLADKRRSIKRLLDRLPDGVVNGLLNEMQARFPDHFSG